MSGEWPGGHGRPCLAASTLRGEGGSMASVLPTVQSASRTAAAQAGVRIEQITIVWMTLEALVAIGAGILARSVLLTAFGIDSVIELVTGSVLVWRLVTEARGGSLERVE